MNSDLAMQMAVALHQAGRLAQAESIYRQILAGQPDHADALHLLGLIAQSAGRHTEAIELIGRAISIAPHSPAFYSNLSISARSLGHVDDAIAACTKAIELKPDYAEAYSNLGDALREKGWLERAVLACSKAIELKPAYAQAHSNLGNALADQGKLAEAVAAHLRAIQIAPDNAESHYNMGAVLIALGRLEESIRASSRAVELKADFPEAWNNLGLALTVMKRLNEAIAACCRAVELKADYAEAWSNLGNALHDHDELDAAVDALRRAIRLRPELPASHNNLGNVYKDQGLIDEALACYSQAMLLKPDEPACHSNRLFALHLHPDFDASASLQAHRNWNQRHAEPLQHAIEPHWNVRNPDRRLKIGYVSPDLHWHPVGRFLLPLLATHDRAAVEVVCYSDAPITDHMTERLRSSADSWRNIAGMAHHGVAQQVREDQIDILVDLTGHTSHNRLIVFARKPAPIQVTWLGYPDTTGLGVMDYRITDAYADPPGLTEAFHAERLHRLPDCFLCFAPAVEAIAVARAPTLRAGQLTFGSFNTAAKINASIVGLWAQILRQTPGAKLMIKNRAMASASTRQHLLNQFDAHGIGSDRLDLRNIVKTHLDHVRIYDEVDIALDTFPYHGTTTTCDALWRGVPVVSLAGEAHVSRAGVSLLSNIGLTELIAHSAEEYVRIATDLASNLPRLSALRSGMRERMLRSVLMDAPRFARRVESAYRQMWRTWCSEDPNDRTPTH